MRGQHRAGADAQEKQAEVTTVHDAHGVSGRFRGPLRTKGLGCGALRVHSPRRRVPAGHVVTPAGLGEAGGGLLLALGLATPAAGAAAAGAMAGAVAVHAPAGFFAQGGGYEYPAFLGFTAAAIGLTGPGRYSVDHATCHAFNQPWTVALAFAGGAVAAAAVVGKRAKGQVSDPGES
ncbi:DoxX family protein [Streptomyces laculatispora]|uniref:DoxX family protein n=1 Tax=Streptomyces laculatispora TaxID=887464 RepID=UPI0035567D35